jgi:hypothetical protein
MELRTGGIYILPNGRELVVMRRQPNPRELFRLSGWGHFELSEYVVNVEGRLECQGKLTAWDVTNLRDTGRSVYDFVGH